MNDVRNARDRLDALLTGLEDEVMQGEGISSTDVTTIRAELKVLIMNHMSETVAQNSLGNTESTESKSTHAKELKKRFKAMVQRAVGNSSLPRVKMAFSRKRDSMSDKIQSKSKDHEDE